MTLTNIVGVRCCFKLLYAIVVVILLHMNNPCIGCRERERQALLAFKQGLIDDNDRLLSWGREAQNKDCCQWDGVYCNNQTGHVVKLDLGDQSLQGKISPKLIHLQHLEYLNLSSNDFNGSKIPDFIGSLSNLIYLDLYFANFGGQIPNQLGNLTRLQYLDLSENSFHAKNLNWLPNLSGLKHLDLTGTDLSDVVGWLEAVNMLPNLVNLILWGCNLPPPIISSVSLMNSSKSLVFVNLRENNLNSSIFQWLSRTHTNLVHLDLSVNNFSGSSIPDNLGNMSSLAFLNLERSELEGRLPNSFAKLCSLQVLHLSENSLSGQFSDFVEILSKCAQNTLEILAMFDSPNIVGSLPDLTNFVLLKTLHLQGNKLSGKIPESIGHMSNLESIDLSWNSFEGVISETHFLKLSKLSFLDLSSNSLVVSFHDDWVPPFQLDQIRLCSCKMGPYFPKWLRTQKSYEWLDIPDNGISDTIPSWFWDLQNKLEYLDLSQNQIRGTLENLRPGFASIVNLGSNQLEGPIPSILSEVAFLNLSNNKFSGSVSFLCTTKESNLTILDLSSNHISGELPNCWFHLKKLVFLNLRDNSLSGKIPTTMGSLFSIETLILNHNRFVGELPSQFKNCRKLTLFDLGENKLSGSIPEWLGANLPNLAVIILGSNQFYKSIPSQLCHLTRLQILDLSMNNISGTIPKCLNNLTTLVKQGNSSPTIQHRYISSMGSIWGYNDEAYLTWKGVRSKYKRTLGLVKSIDLSSNKLIGEIPSEITYLVGLISLNLSRNQLTGQIPSRIGNLQELDSLDLSRNQINGRIPTTLARIDRIGKLDLSQNNLSGKIPIGTQLQSFDPSSYAENPLLCGLPLPTCPEDEKSPGQPVLVNKDDKDGLITQGFYISIGLGFAVGFWGVCGTLLLNRSCRLTCFSFLTFLHDWLYVKASIIRPKMLNK
ncbi:putative LRR receptor-like serine/threonine-protein kinase [Prunus yedoensis var. nudiflora]|uniref:Putative LRR receptor-like serine/threonine-protein kinase n=1 Tax=Prunus yedoensis var. nudiflora TaxID=2094558 RepID=A0A314V0Z1_PRUYE|nr:putative LRR receptor-like serine/threonine-protein kinase [Prunus yedoensis var. nudiflora]